MTGVAVKDGNDVEQGGRPGEAARRRVAVELIRDHDRPLRWTARRYSICTEDAEDAYQRGIEILLSKAPTTDLRQLLPWARTVIKHEALAIRKSRERTMASPGGPSDGDLTDEDWVQLIPATGDGPDELAVRKERIARSREALAELKPAELKALTQLAEGFSYAEIGEMNRWTRTKVNRCLAEGRARFRNAFQESESGERCSAFELMISASCDGELSSQLESEVRNHLATCGYCRSTLRAYRAAPKAAAALAPAVPFGGGLWERVQELFLTAQLRFQGVGKASETGLQGALASGGTGGAGMAAAAKLAAICAGTAGTAAVCAVTGIVPGVSLLPRNEEKPAIERPVQAHDPIGPREAEAAPETEPEVVPSPEPQEPTPEAVQPQPQPVATAPEPAPVIASTPAPTPTEAEFTPEASGTPAPVSAPPPQPASSPVPVGNGGGEFAP